MTTTPASNGKTSVGRCRPPGTAGTTSDASNPDVSGPDKSKEGPPESRAEAPPVQETPSPDKSVAPDEKPPTERITPPEPTAEKEPAPERPLPPEPEPVKEAPPKERPPEKYRCQADKDCRPGLEKCCTQSGNCVLLTEQCR